MLRFRLLQIRVPSLERYFLPLPKLDRAGVDELAVNLESRGYAVRKRGYGSRILAARGGSHISIDGSLGLAASGSDMLDALGPATPPLLSHLGGGIPGTRDQGAAYFLAGASRAATRVRFFARMESLSTWAALRRDGLSGITPDEAEAIRLAVAVAPRGSLVGCVTSAPRDGSRPFRLGRRVYYRSWLPVQEFLVSLRTVDSGGGRFAAYLPRSAVIELSRPFAAPNVPHERVGEWCLG